MKFVSSTSTGSDPRLTCVAVAEAMSAQAWNAAVDCATACALVSGPRPP